MMKITLIPSNLALLFYLCFANFFTQAEQTKQVQGRLVICIGQASSSSNNSALQSLVNEMFNTTGLQPDLFYSPTKRAEHLFKVGECDGFFVSSNDFPTQIQRDDIVHVPESIMTVHVDAFVYKGDVCKVEQSCLQSLAKSQVVGVFRSHALMKYLKTRTSASVVELTTLEQGTKMLEHSRIDVLVIPNININTSRLLNVERVASVELYLWLDKKYAPYLEEVSMQVRRLKSGPKWTLLNPSG
ncbi:hypothetical protein DXX93_13895 [Thalassotalea euphylliae]|uniref:Solute-binding protein family 3/N-terminal domain-containing protein n=1 Tax=Thalassotalea euphylliae TaxID=1655234 RepID=A0A3E0TSZ8_9GAMM|nr:hypothetical protein [Thalassotalea euphylliae]REL27544.1 hypothetical protein DXX93_13895 [Thalassotalea euphylliae]